MTNYETIYGIASEAMGDTQLPLVTRVTIAKTIAGLVSEYIEEVPTGTPAEQQICHLLTLDGLHLERAIETLTVREYSNIVKECEAEQGALVAKHDQIKGLLMRMSAIAGT